MFMIDLGAPSYYSTLNVSPSADIREIRDRKQRIAGDLMRKQQRTTDPSEKRRLEQLLVQINKIGGELSSPELREKYDRENAHLTFFVPRRVAAPILGERELRLRWMHRGVRDFLLAKGETLEPMTDLERTDFTADFTANELLERMLLKEGHR